MTSRILHILMGLSVLVATANCHALPTQETLVITKSDEDATKLEASSVEPTTEEPDKPIKMTEMDVRSEITMRYAYTSVVAYVQNPSKRAQEASFRVLLPETAFISGFIMTLDGKSYKAYVKEKEEAKKIYNEAVSQGFGAAHVAAKARDSNIFTVSVNVEPKMKAVFNLTYEELLTRRNGVYNHAINLHPGGLVPKLTVTVHVKESQGISVLRVPEIRTGNEIDATDEDAPNEKAVIVRSSNNNEATITFTPDLEEQKTLIQVYKEKSKQRRGDRYGFDVEDQGPQDGSLGQFVVQYDVDRTKTNEILVNNGYFVHFFAPTSLPPLSKHVVFVLDTSGSMSGRKIEQLIEAMQTILSKLNKGDIFNIVQFESAVEILDIANSKEVDPPNNDFYYYRRQSFEIPTLLPPVEATPENIAKATRIVSKLRASGGTNIGTALDTAIALIQNGRNITAAEMKKDSEKSDVTEKVNTAEPEKQKDKEIKDDTKDDELSNDQKEPIIIFLTDGEPTVGEGNPSRIINIVSEKNYGIRKASIYALAFGEDADRSFLRKLALKNDGLMRHIYEASDASLQLRDFYRQISSPLLANVKFVYPPEQVKDGSVTKHKFRRFYAGSEMIVAGRIEDDVAELEPYVYGVCGVGLNEEGRKRFEVSTKTPVERKSDAYLPLERLWAYLTIQQLLDERHVVDISDDDEKSPAKKALALALKYEFVTALTSLVVVKPNATSAVDAESADKVSASPLSTSLAQPGFAPPRGPSFLSNSLSGHSSYFSSSLQSNSAPIALSGSMPEALPDMNTYAEADVDYYGFMNRAAIVTPHLRYSPFMKHWSSNDMITTPAPLLTTSLAPLETYHLNGYTWAESLLNSSSDCISIRTNGTQVDLKLTKDVTAPVSASGDAECATATDATAGLCVYLTRCSAARDITADLYSRTYCVVSDGYAGVCCPKNKVEKTN
ncbi:inter alpha-trypsin inhibitor, heavy chain 4-like isoform X2 [Battus philenor]|uniref:inter alpha-trypsin inhibitor, heavy chain 4-like isoform X2 n=1 Tax=Battus philenor TaxID=42288 RepID=UPI0035D0DD4D